MSLESVVQRAFVGGELSPALHARADQTKYVLGLQLCRNLIVQRHGGVQKRSGTRFVAAAKTVNDTRLLPFIFEAADQTYVIEVGGGYFRWFWHGAPVVVSGVAAWSNAVNYVVGDLVVQGGVNYYCILAHINQVPPNATYWYPLTGTIYEVPNAYAANDLSRLQWSQSADILTIVHPSYAPIELQRLGHTTWRVVTYTTAPSISAPTGLAGTAGAAGTLNPRYVVTAFKASTFEESYPSASYTIVNAAPPTEALPNQLTWNAVSGAAEYGVYCDRVGNGVYGFIGAAANNAFFDPNYTPDFTVTPPLMRTLFASSGNYPSTTTNHQQRQWFGGSNNERETVWGSQVGAYHNFSISTPLQDDDAITFVLAGQQLNPVNHLLGLKRLIVFTDAGEHVINGDESGAITPAFINPEQVGYVGSYRLVRPVAVGDSAIYVQARGIVVRDLTFNQAETGPQLLPAGKDLTIYASHLFFAPLRDMVVQPIPNSVVWATRTDGTLLGLTYIKEQEIWAWHRHQSQTSAGFSEFEYLCVVPDSSINEDVLYAVVKRVINGSTVRYIEKFEPAYKPDVDDLLDAFFVDSGLSYSGAPATVFAGLSHLEGQRVAVLGDGIVVTNGADAVTLTVSGGSVTLPAPRSVVKIGLPMPTADLETLRLDVEGSGVRDKAKRVQSLTALLWATPPGWKAGPDTAHLKPQRPEGYQSATAPFTGSQDLIMPAGFEQDGHVLVRSETPVPFYLLGLIPRVEVARG